MPERIPCPDELPPIRVRAKFFFEGDRKWFLKGVTYGPFKANADGDFISTPEQARKDFALMRELGINLIRVYHVPPRWLLDLATEFRLRVLISIPWTQHVEFLNSRALRRQILQVVRSTVAKNKGHPAIFAYLVGNEVPTTIVRWLRADRVQLFLEELIDAARETDPRPLYSYASFPPTEYLRPANVDFLTLNVYLERRLDFERYLARLQNIAEDKPLLLGEFGLDTQRNGEDRQAEVLDWHLDSVVLGGAAGTIFFSWTDEWFTGGHEVTDWQFGLVTADRRAKRAFHVLKAKLADAGLITARIRLRAYPRVSVIVCSYNGAKTLGDCLKSLDEIQYPNFEIVLVDDGSTDRTQEIVKEWQAARMNAKAPPHFVNIVQRNMGLSYARNVGAQAAGGEILAYTDGDCMPDPDWLYYLVAVLLSGDFAGVGGPNISPPAVNSVQAAVAASPGGPSHVLLTDVVAEHVPGCNMAFWRWAFDLAGGFDPEYRKAGDDVDFCWRLQTRGGVVAFSPSAIVWHYRRFTLRAFRKQQEGYGEAEAMLRFKHLIFFGPTGTAKWKGQIYGAPRLTWLFSRPLIYHGVFGQGLFQTLYPAQQSVVAAYLSSIEWFALTIFIGVLGIPLQWLRIVPVLMLLGSVSVALSWMVNIRIEPKYDTIPARLLVGFLAFIQPLGRGWARYFTWLKFKRTPARVIATPEPGLAREEHSGGITRINFWNETGAGREALLAETVKLLDEEGWRYSMDTGWKRWDVLVYGTLWWSVKVATVTEYHGGPKCLTRARLGLMMVPTTFLVNAILLSALLYRQFIARSGDRWLWVAFVLFVIWLARRGYRLKRRVADLLIHAAQTVGLNRVSGEKAKPRAAP
jgi:O-antigen biosynthesis protein